MKTSNQIALGSLVLSAALSALMVLVTVYVGHQTSAVPECSLTSTAIASSRLVVTQTKRQQKYVQIILLAGQTEHEFNPFLLPMQGDRIYLWLDWLASRGIYCAWDKHSQIGLLRIGDEPSCLLFSAKSNQMVMVKTHNKAEFDILFSRILHNAFESLCPANFQPYRVSYLPCEMGDKPYLPIRIVAKLLGSEAEDVTFDEPMGVNTEINPLQVRIRLHVPLKQLLTRKAAIQDWEAPEWVCEKLGV